MIATEIGPWLEAFIILGYYTILYGPNTIFRTAQGIALGASIGYYFVYSYDRLISVGVQPMSEDIILIIPLILGALTFARISDRYGWIARYPTAWLMGLGFGILAPSTVVEDIQAQVVDTVQQLAAADIIDKINALVVVAGLITVMIYFIYTLKLTRPVTTTMKIGRYFLMAALGAGAADFATGSLGWAIDPISRVVKDWMQLGGV